MNAMAYPAAYPAAPGQSVNQIIKRPLTDAERQLPGRFYKTIQNGLRGLSLVCLILFVFNTYLITSIITDPVTYDTVSIMLSVFMLVFGAVAIGMSVNAIVVRKRIGQAMRDGTAVEVFGPAYRTSGMGKAQSWTVGPVSMLPTRELMGLLQEGMPTSVLCLTRMKAAIAVNNYGLRTGARIMFPPNLEAMAVPVGMAAMPTSNGIHGVPSPFYGAPAPAIRDPQGAYEDELPPPPTD